MTLAFHICTDLHRMFLYSFGVDDVTCSDLPCSHATTFTVQMKSQWWRGKPKKSEELWPNERSRFVTFERVHEHLPDSPFCIYIMLHRETVKASALSEQDLARFKFTYRVNGKLFNNLPDSQEIHVKVDKLAEKLKGHVFVNRVVNCDIVIKMTDDLHTKFSKMCLSTMSKMNNPDQLKASMELQFELVNTFCIEVRNLDQLAASREIQLNDWATDDLKKELNSLGFSAKVEFPHNRYSLFGKSRPDFAFLKETNSELHGGLLMDQETIYGGTLEFKVDSLTSKLPQGFANMVRVGNDMLYDTLI